jgi:tagatose-1,6-bisphosphate aldolase
MHCNNATQWSNGIVLFLFYYNDTSEEVHREEQRLMYVYGDSPVCTTEAVINRVELLVYDND